MTNQEQSELAMSELSLLWIRGQWCCIPVLHVSSTEQILPLSKLLMGTNKTYFTQYCGWLPTGMFTKQKYSELLVNICAYRLCEIGLWSWTWFPFDMENGKH